ncbi:MAG: hypothetical protein LW808_002795 [Verrucomicrobiota bacterium]|nr:MAG: hypothetical protein LW808_002795 [Verrucomicrobiota bacterium]
MRAHILKVLFLTVICYNSTVYGALEKLVTPFDDLNWNELPGDDEKEEEKGHFVDQDAIWLLNSDFRCGESIVDFQPEAVEENTEGFTPNIRLYHFRKYKQTLVEINELRQKILDGDHGSETLEQFLNKMNKLQSVGLLDEDVCEFYLFPSDTVQEEEEEEEETSADAGILRKQSIVEIILGDWENRPANDKVLVAFLNFFKGRFDKVWSASIDDPRLLARIVTTKLGEVEESESVKKDILPWSFFFTYARDIFNDIVKIVSSEELPKGTRVEFPIEFTLSNGRGVVLLPGII